MACLTREEIVRVAIHSGAIAGLARHVECCAACKARVDQLQATAARLDKARARFKRGHEEAWERLAASLPAIRGPEPLGVLNRIVQWMGGVSMRRRIVVGGVGLAAALGILLAWSLMTSRPLSAMERVAKNIREAKSLSARSVVKCDVPIGTVLGTHMEWFRESSLSTSCLASGEQRVDTHLDGVLGGTQISLPGQPGIDINHRKRVYIWQSPGSWGEESVRFIEKLGKFSGQVDRDLGSRQLGDVRATGFQIAAEKLDMGHMPDMPGTVDVWVDPQTELPVLVEGSMGLGEGLKVRFVIEDFRWNEELDPKLFQTEPPEGYADRTLAPSSDGKERPIVVPEDSPEGHAKGMIVGGHASPEEQAEEITRGLKTYAELCGGSYPRVARPSAKDALADMAKAAGILPPSSADFRLRKEQVPTALKIKRAKRGFNWLDLFFLQGADAAYYGSSVGPNDKDKVLVRWKLEDGRYEVIYGDLRAETVTAQRLRTLEGK